MESREALEITALSSVFEPGLQRRSLVTIEICLGQNCKAYGGQALAEVLTEKGVPFQVFECRSLCTYAPVAFVAGKAKLRATLDDVVVND